MRAIGKVGFLFALLMSVALPASAAVITDGFWDYNNLEGYKLYAEQYVDAGNGNRTDTGILGIKTDGTNLYLLFVEQLTVNDNTYGTNAVGWSGMHSFSQLTGSDAMTLDLSSPKTYNANIDYLSKSAPWVSEGTGGGDGAFNSGTAGAAALTAWATALQWDMDTSHNTCGAPTTNSPDTDGGAAGSTANSNYYSNKTNPNCGTWVFPILFELQFSLSALGISGGATADQIHAMVNWTVYHNSPAKNNGSADTNVCDDGIVGPSGSNASTQLGCSSGVSTVPEPTTLLLLGSGLLAACRVARRRKA